MKPIPIRQLDIVRQFLLSLGEPDLSHNPQLVQPPQPVDTLPADRAVIVIYQSERIHTYVYNNNHVGDVHLKDRQTGSNRYILTPVWQHLKQDNRELLVDDK